MSKLFTLPALRSLGELAGTQPLIVVDTREQEPLEFTRLQSVRRTLTSGDYSAHAPLAEAARTFE